jgi:hypothetical protein
LRAVLGYVSLRRVDAGEEFGIEIDGFVDPGNRGD